MEQHEHRIATLERSHEKLAGSLSDLREAFVVFRAEVKTYARTAMIVFGVVHPILVGIVSGTVVYMLTRG